MQDRIPNRMEGRIETLKSAIRVPVQGTGVIVADALTQTDNVPAQQARLRADDDAFLEMVQMLMDED